MTAVVTRGLPSAPRPFDLVPELRAALVLGATPLALALWTARGGLAADFVTLGLLTAAGLAAACGLAGAAWRWRRPGTVPWTAAGRFGLLGLVGGSLGLLWTLFWWRDLHEAQFAWVLLLVPGGALVGAVAAAWPREGVIRVSTVALLALALGLVVLVSPRWPGLFARSVAWTDWVALVAAVAILPGRPTRPGAGALLGAMAGLAFVWTLGVLRSDNGCTGVGPTYAAVHLLALPLLFGLGPLAAGWAIAPPSAGSRPRPRRALAGPGAPAAVPVAED